MFQHLPDVYYYHSFQTVFLKFANLSLQGQLSPPLLSVPKFHLPYPSVTEPLLPCCLQGNLRAGIGVYAFGSKACPLPLSSSFQSLFLYLSEIEKKKDVNGRQYCIEIIRVCGVPSVSSNPEIRKKSFC